MANGEAPQPPAEYQYDIPDDLRAPKYANCAFTWTNTARPREIVLDFAFYTPDGTRKPTVVARVVMSRDAVVELCAGLQSTVRLHDQIRSGGQQPPPSEPGRR